MPTKNKNPQNPDPRPTETTQPAETQDQLIKEQIREALEAGNLPRAAELMDRLKQPALTAPMQARINLLLTLAFMLVCLWFFMPIFNLALDWWY